MPRRKTQEEFINEVKAINPHLLITGKYLNGNSKMTCTCSNCGYIWTSTARNLIKPKKCLKCLNELRKILPIDMSHNEFVKQVKNINPNIKVVGTYVNGMNTITCICLKDGYKSRIRCNLLLKPYECKFCKNGRENIIIGVNDIHSVNPILGQMLLNYDDGYKYTVNSRAKVDFKCLNCGNIIRNKSISNVNRRGITCICSDGISFPEKYTYSVLSQISSNVEYQKIINNYNGYRYDFYGVAPNNETWIVEVMGKQHSIKSFETCGGRSLSEEKVNDKNKYEFALSNNIDNYIIIEAKETSYKNMKQSILNSKLNDLYDLSKVDWNKAYRDALSSKIVDACNLWNQGLHRTVVIGKTLNIKRQTARRYLIKGSSIGLCNYNPNEIGKIKVVCLNTGEIYNSMREAEIRYDINRGYISGYLKGDHKVSGYLPNGEKLLWQYYEDYIKSAQSDKDLSA